VSKSHLQDKFLVIWESHGPSGYQLYAEHSFAPPRRWKFDFALPDHLIAIELEGLGGRHQRTAGFRADMEKYNTATSMGWRVLRFTGSDLSKPADVFKIIESTIRLVEATVEA